VLRARMTLPARSPAFDVLRGHAPPSRRSAPSSTRRRARGGPRTSQG
jgi:hypothetical protein